MSSIMQSTIRPIRPDERALLERRERVTPVSKVRALLSAVRFWVPIWLGLSFIGALFVARITLVDAGRRR